MKILCKLFGHKYERKYWKDEFGECCSYACKRCGCGGGSSDMTISFVQAEFGGNGGSSTLNVNGFGRREIKRPENDYKKQFVATSKYIDATTGKYIDVSNNCRTCFGSGKLTELLISRNNKSLKQNVKCHDCGGTGKIKND